MHPGTKRKFNEISQNVAGKITSLGNNMENLKIGESKMTVSNEKICKVPISGKEVYSKKSILCGEHKRSIKENSKNILKK